MTPGLHRVLAVVAAIAATACARARPPDYRSGKTSVVWDGTRAADFSRAEFDAVLARVKAQAPCPVELAGEVHFRRSRFRCERDGGTATAAVSGCLYRTGSTPTVTVVYAPPLLASALVDELGHVAWIECHGDGGSAADFQKFLLDVRRDVGW